VNAERLRREAQERADEAQSVRSQSDDQVRRANSLDPDTDARGRPTDTDADTRAARHVAGADNDDRPSQDRA
jgi:hypothetical protein